MFKQFELPFASNALEPHIDALTVETHHGKHHAAYTKNFNDAAEKAGVADMDIEALLASLDKVEDAALRKALRNNGGGYYNHNLYFSTISPNAAKAPKGELLKKIEAEFGSVDALKEKLTALASGQFGSGWAWLSVNKEGKLMASASPNQDNPIIEGTGFVPILAIDVWEHAYYLKYKNLRGAYIKELFEIIDWSLVEKNYERVTK
ncbi:MAG: superoxide dismutase [Clostridia bacterium]|nr:superoxide dismutase [Clostridia bacterium]MBQ1375055.1 superoxide dismutase [Clostridia bacterium]MBQ1434679.1 superoxide dismutase [Clostridia bacterium]MBQ4249061.1 superoxide dismutase [Clostridia bacterium]